MRIANHADARNDKEEFVGAPSLNGAGDDHVRADIEMMLILKDRLSVADFGRLAVQITRAAAAKRPSELQRLLLAIVGHREPQT